MRVRRLALFLALCASTAAAREAGPGGWEESQSVPEWVASPPAREGFVRVVDAGQSNRLDLAYPLDSEGLLKDVVRRAIRTEVARRLRLLLGKEADLVADTVPATATLVRKGFHSSPSERGKQKGFGGTITAWVLWEIPTAPLLAAVPEARRADAKKALEGASPPASPAWHIVDAKPDWVDAPSVSHGNVTIVSEMGSDDVEVAKANSWLIVHLHDEVIEPLRSMVSPDDFWNLLHAAESWRSLVWRAVMPGRDGSHSKAWTHWHVPLGALLDALPERKREAARAALLKR